MDDMDLLLRIHCGDGVEENKKGAYLQRYVRVESETP